MQHPAHAQLNASPVINESTNESGKLCVHSCTDVIGKQRANTLNNYEEPQKWRGHKQRNWSGAFYKLVPGGGAQGLRTDKRYDPGGWVHWQYHL